MNVSDEAFATSAAFGLLFVIVFIFALAKGFCIPSNARENSFKFIFFVIFLAQLALRIVFVTVAVLPNSGQLGTFWNTLPACVHVSLTTYLLLQWIKAIETRTFTLTLILFVVLNLLLYLVVIVITSFQNPRLEGIELETFLSVYGFSWFALIFAVIYFMVKTYPWTDPTKEWIRYKKPVLYGFGTICICVLIRICLLAFSVVQYKNPFNFYTSDSNPIPFYLFLIYYGIGEIAPGILMVITQMNLPSKFGASYGELEKLMQKYKDATPADSWEDKIMCKICMEKEIDTCLLYCNHSVLCYDCAVSLKDCPICRKPIQQVLKIYRS